MSTQCHLMPYTGLPIEVFLHCCSFLDYPSLCAAERVSPVWHQALSIDREYDFDLTQLERLKQLARDKRLTVLIDTPMLMENWIAKRNSFETAPLGRCLKQAVSTRDAVSVKFLLQFEGYEPRDLRLAFGQACFFPDGGDDIVVYEPLGFLWNVPAFQEYHRTFAQFDPQTALVTF